MTILKLKNHILNINIYKSKRNKYIDNLYYLIIHSISMTQATVLLHAAIFKHIYIYSKSKRQQICLKVFLVIYLEILPLQIGVFLYKDEPLIDED